MEEIVIEDSSGDKRLQAAAKESPATVSLVTANNSIALNSFIGSASSSSSTAANQTGAAAVVEDPSSRVMSMLYLQPSSNTSITSPTQPASSAPSVQAHQAAGPQVVVGTSKQQQQPQQIAAFDQILLQGIAQSKQTQIPTQLITIRRQVNSVTSPPVSQAQKNIIVRKSNATNAQIMPIGIPDNQAQNQAGSKPKVTYLSTIIKPKPQESVVLPAAGTINATQSIKQKVVFAPVYSQISPGSTSNSLQSQTPKHMTNLILPVSISQPSAPAAASKQSINFKPSNFTFKFNNGQISNDPKSTITVLRESKTSNGTTNPPPLHPIANMTSLLNASKSGGSSAADGVKINENPDSAVITPIPKKEEPSASISAEKRKRPISNILRGEKRMRKQSFTKTNLNQDASVVEVSGYGLNSPESEHDKDKKKDKESDDDITLIKVVPSEEKKHVKRLSMSDEIKLEVVKGLNRNGVEVIEKFEKVVNGKSNSDDVKEQPKTESTRILEWKDGVGTLVGTSLKFCMNEFGFTEVLDEAASKDKNKNIGDKENVCLTQNSSKSSTPTIVVNEKKSSDEKKSQSAMQDDKTFCHCQGCGCHGPLSDFYNQIACSSDCAQYIEIKQQKLRKEKESKQEMRAKKKRRKLLEQALKDEERTKESGSKLKDSDEKSRDSDDKSDRVEVKVKCSSDEDTKDTNISTMDDENQGDSEAKYPWLTGKLKFSWSKYLEFTKAKAAPTKLFKDAFPDGRNNFKVGMKLEGIDPNHPSHYCVLTVAEVIGYRLRLHFDGYAENFDFWVNADSADIFPVGWAEKNGRQLQPPKGYVSNNFSWNAYMKLCKASAAPKTLFSNKNSLIMTGFRVGMKLEAVDRKHSSLVCVASVADVLDSRILVHFDSWDDIYDYWADVSSPYIHPVGWCHHNGRSLTPPNYYKDAKAFSWDEYLKSSNSTAAPARAFKQRPPCGFKRGMKLEAVDRRLPQVIRVATVEDVKDHMLKIRFDGWPENHAYWVDDDSPEIHPMGWCTKTGHPLEPPITHDNLNNRSECGTFGCRGIGHVKGPKFATHNSASGCPYSPQNVIKPKSIKDRLNIKHDINDFDDDSNTMERIKSERIEKKSERFEKRFPSFEEKLIKDSIKHEDDYISDRNERIDISERISSKWQNHSDEQSDDEECSKKRKKRKLKEDLSILNSSNDVSSSRSSYAPNIPEKQLRLELYQSVYDPGYNPTPKTQQMWAKHSSALNRVIAKQTTNPLRWSCEEVVKFIQSLPNCKDISHVFRNNNIDGDAFMALSQDDLVTHIGLRIGPALKVYNSIVLLRRKVT